MDRTDHHHLVALTPLQTTAATGRKLPRRTLGWGTKALLIGLRVYVFLAIPIVIYAFMHALGQ